MKSDSISIERSGDDVMIALAGRWIIERANDLNRGLEALAPGPAKAITIDLGPAESLDTAVAWLVYRTVKRLRGEGYTVAFIDRRPELAVLLDLVEANDHPVECHPPVEAEWHAVIGHVGRATLDYVGDISVRLPGLLDDVSVTLVAAESTLNTVAAPPTP